METAKPTAAGATDEGDPIRYFCGACGATMLGGPPPCVSGQEDHRLPPAEGYPDPDWRRLNPDHPYLTALEEFLRPQPEPAVASPVPAAGKLVWLGHGWGPEPAME